MIATRTEGAAVQLNNEIVIITGGGRGIGAALAMRFASEGAKIVVADLDEGAAMATAGAIGGLGVRCDVTKEDDIKGMPGI